MRLRDHATRSSGRNLRACRALFPTDETISLRRLRAHDRSAFLASIDDEVCHWQGWDERVVESMQRTFLARTRLEIDGRPSELAVAERSTDRLIGVYGVAYYSENPRVDLPSLGWWLAPDARGQGYGHTSLALALEYVHTTMRIPEVQIGTRSDNERVLLQLRRVGAQPFVDVRIAQPDGSVAPGTWFLHSADAA